MIDSTGVVLIAHFEAVCARVFPQALEYNNMARARAHLFIAKLRAVYSKDPEIRGEQMCASAPQPLSWSLHHALRPAHGGGGGAVNGVRGCRGTMRRDAPISHLAPMVWQVPLHGAGTM